MIDNKTLNTLEYDKILSKLASHLHSEASYNFVMNLKPSNNLKEVIDLLNLTNQADIILYEYSVGVDLSIPNLDQILDNIEKNATLSISEIQKIGRLLSLSRIVKNNIQAVNDNRLKEIKECTYSIYTDVELEKDISSSFVGENEVSDNASSNLKDIRRQIRACNDRITQKLQNYLSGSTSKYLQDNLITVRNNRYVLPVKAEYRSQIQGLIHDQSSTGSTIYIEPISIVNLNNELKQYHLDEEHEIDLILRRFSNDINGIANAIKEDYNTCIILDSIFAKAAYAHSIDAIMPNISDGKHINIIKGRHPLIPKDQVVAVSVSIGDSYDTLVITGPNTGGKTVLLKLTGLMCLMSMTGMFIPCEVGSEIAVFDNIFCDIGDKQSIENNLSTYSSHITNIVDITNKVTNNCLCLLDELGAGTDPNEGSALAIAIIEFLRSKNCLTVTTSHYSELKEYAYATDGVMVASMDFNPINFKPTYKLLIGISGGSKALEIASNLGLDHNIINNAKSKFSDQKIGFDKVIMSAEKARREAEELRNNIALKEKEISSNLNDIEKMKCDIKLKQQKLDDKIAKNVKYLLQDYIEEADELIEEIKEEVKKGDEQALFNARKIKSKLSNKVVDSEYKPQVTKLAGNIEIGDSVFVKSINTTGKVVEYNSKKKEYLIKAGILTTKVKASEIYKVKVEENANYDVKPKTINLGPRNEDITSEVKLLGMRADEAIAELDKYLNSAVMQGFNEVRVVHGKGTGILRKVVQEHLKTHPSVESFRLGNWGEGDTGVTIVKLK